MYFVVEFDGFGHVAYVDFDIGIGFAIGNFEIEPKQMPPGIGINPQKQIILILANLNNTVQITGLKPGIKFQLFVPIDGGIHSLKSPVIDLILIKLVLAHGFLCIGLRQYCEEIVIFVYLFVVEFVSVFVCVFFVQG